MWPIRHLIRVGAAGGREIVELVSNEIQLDVILPEEIARHEAVIGFRFSQLGSFATMNAKLWPVAPPIVKEAMRACGR